MADDMEKIGREENEDSRAYPVACPVTGVSDSGQYLCFRHYGTGSGDTAGGWPDRCTL